MMTWKERLPPTEKVYSKSLPQLYYIFYPTKAYANEMCGRDLAVDQCISNTMDFSRHVHTQKRLRSIRSPKADDTRAATETKSHAPRALGATSRSSLSPGSRVEWHQSSPICQN
ncbi:hypothetical protein BaRGS_00030929 [Batillaria attramentaria]|uniref:Uncharacterized protein n=1 Tax=Batillaria attramentaria TaxID=370345 RepID=A0ABD0JSW7_9CAEN